MRKALKIKALTLGFAWLIIFLHGAIPHNHAYQNFGCTDFEDHTLHHEEGQLSSDNDLLLTQFKDQHSETLCHFNPELFSQDNPDSYFIIETGNPSSINIYLSKEKILVINSDCQRPPLLKNISLRGPPIS